MSFALLRFSTMKESRANEYDVSQFNNMLDSSQCPVLATEFMIFVIEFVSKRLGSQKIVFHATLNCLC